MLAFAGLLAGCAGPANDSPGNRSVLWNTGGGGNLSVTIRVNQQSARAARVAHRVASGYMLRVHVMVDGKDMVEPRTVPAPDFNQSSLTIDFGWVADSANLIVVELLDPSGTMISSEAADFNWTGLDNLVLNVPLLIELPASVNAITITPNPVTLAPQDQQLFVATGGSGTGYQWAIPSNNSGGSIDKDSGLYTAGSTTNVNDTVKVTDSQGNTATATVTVTRQLTLTPDPVSLYPGDTQTFTATGGSGEGYVFSIKTNKSGGSIDPSTGEYTAGTTSGVTDVVSVKDSADNTAEATVVVLTPMELTLQPDPVTLFPGNQQTFTASGGRPPYAFSINENNSGASIDAGTGAYTAGETTGVDDVVKVTDSKGNTATATVHVRPPLTIAPTTVGRHPGQQQTFTAAGGSGSGYVFSIKTNSSGGTIDPTTGGYTAGSTTDVTDTVQVKDSDNNTATATVTVTAVPALTLAPNPVTLHPEDTQTFTASGGSGGGYVYSIKTNNSGGTINDSTGKYTAGTTNNVDDVVLVTDSEDNTATATVHVRPPLVIAPKTVTVEAGTTKTFTATGGSGSGYVFSIKTNNSGGSINGTSGVYTAGSTTSVSDTVMVTDSEGATDEAVVSVVAATEIYFTDGAVVQTTMSGTPFFRNCQFGAFTTHTTFPDSIPTGIGLDASGRIYVIGSNTHSFYRMDDIAGTNLVSADGLGQNNTGPSPTNIAVDKKGGVGYIASNPDSIKFISQNSYPPSNEFVMVISGETFGQRAIAARVFTFQGGPMREYFVTKLGCDDEDRGGWIKLFDQVNGTPAKAAYGTTGSGVGQFKFPNGIALDSLNRIYIADRGNSRIVRIDDMSGTNWTEIGTNGSGVKQFSTGLAGIAIDRYDRIYACDGLNTRIVRMDDMDGNGWTTLDSAFPAHLMFQPQYITVK